jgi:hypothetical protein
MPAIEGYIEKCHPENSTVDRGVSRGEQWNSRDDIFKSSPLVQGVVII